MFYCYHEMHISIKANIKVFNDRLIFIGTHYMITLPEIL